MSHLEAVPARPEDFVPAFRLLFRNLSVEEREFRIVNALGSIGRNELDPSGLFVVRDAEALLGVIVCAPVPVAGGLVWPPQAEGPRQTEIEDCLVRCAREWLCQRGAKLCQSLLATQEVSLAAPLERNGFAHITQLWSMRRFLDSSTMLPSGRAYLSYRTLAECDHAIFHRTLLRTYENTLDFPEMNGVRDIEEILEGHRVQGRHDPHLWWLALHAGNPVGVLLLTEMPEEKVWDLMYLGLVGKARGKGLGRELAVKALYEARAAGATQLTLAVDGRNRPAWNLYRALDFEPHDHREVYLAIWT